MKLNLPKKFRLRDTVELEDPLGMGWQWKLKYYGNPEHAEYLREKNEDGGPFDEFLQLQNKCMAAALVEANNKGLKGKASEDYRASRAAELYAEKVFDLDVEKIEFQIASPEGLVDHVIASIGGVEVLDGDVAVSQPYSRDLGLDILSRSEPLPFDYEEEANGEDDDGFAVSEGTPLGVFYCRWVTRHSQQAAAFRESELESAGKA
jgi:hypothetical protein